MLTSYMIEELTRIYNLLSKFGLRELLMSPINLNVPVTWIDDLTLLALGGWWQQFNKKDTYNSPKMCKIRREGICFLTTDRLISH